MKKIILLGLLINILIFTSCKKDNKNSLPQNLNIYVAGSTSNYNTYRQATYWKNGNPYSLPLSTGSYTSRALSIAVQGNDVYTAGYEYTNDGIMIPVYWKNDSIVILPGELVSSTPVAIGISGTDVFVSGNVQVGQNFIPQYWKNGIPLALGESTGTAGVVSCLFVSGADVYMGGAVGGYWRNGIFQKLEGFTGEVVSIAVLGQDIYMTGMSGDNVRVATSWKNGRPLVLSEPAGAEGRSSSTVSLAVSGNNIFIAGMGFNGYYNNSVSRYWINNRYIDLNNNNLSAVTTCIAVDGNDVYVTGFRYDEISGNFVATYWKNGKLIDVTDNTGTSELTSIFLTRD